MKEKLSEREFRLMHFVMRCIDFVSDYVKKRSSSFGIKEGETVIDYACGPGRYTIEFSKLVGSGGKVIAVDLIEIALEAVLARVNKLGLTNVEIVLANGYDSTLPSQIADKVFVLDAIHHIHDSNVFLNELSRICKVKGCLIIDKGHITRSSLKQKIESSSAWKIVEENSDHLLCVRLSNLP